MKKLMKAAVVAFAIALLLAVSSFAAYSVNLDGTVSGLEDGVEYTAFKYDFASEDWADNGTLTASTQLTPGVWGIKAGDADIEALFVSGSENGVITFWNAENMQPAYNTSGNADTFVPGKWNVSKNSAARAVAFYVASNKSEASICIYLVKAKYLQQVEDTAAAQKTVTVEGVAYPVYRIEDVEYYLKPETTGEGDEAVTTDKYYSVADNSLYEGEGEAVAVFPLTWKNAEPIMGDGNLLQEIVVRYGFTESQIVPAKDVVSIPNSGLTILTGGNALGEGYTKADVKGTFTFVVKTPGVEGYQRYVVDIDAGSVGKAIAAPAEMAESEGYLVAFEFAPYANCPDDIFKGSAGDSAAECYAHYFLKCNGDLNIIDYTAHLLPAPEGLIDGFGTIGGFEDGKTYEIASATINSDGSGLVLGDWSTFDPDDRSLVGLYAVREVYGDRVTDIAYAYAYGSHAERKTPGQLGGTNGKTVQVVGGQTFTPGYYGGNYTTYWTNVEWEIMSHGQVGAGPMKASMDARAAYDALVASGTATEEELAAAKATLDEKNTALIGLLNAVNLKYAYAPEEIIPTKLVNSFRITAKQNNGYFTLIGNQQKKAVAFVADNTGMITRYEEIISQPFSTNLDFTVDFASFLPEDGYLVAFEIYPCTNITLDTFGKVTAGNAFRYYTKVDPSNYSIDEPEALPVAGDKPEGLSYDAAKGIVSGLDADERYQWTRFTLEGISEDAWNAVPAGDTTIDVNGTVGIIAVRYMGNGYSNIGSMPVYFYAPGGEYNDFLNLIEVVGTGGSNNGLTIGVPVVERSVDDGTVQFKEGTWKGIYLVNDLATVYSYAPLTLGTTGTPISVNLAKAINTAQTEYDALVAAGASDTELAAAQAKLDAARKAQADRNAKIHYSYAYKPEQIIRFDEFVSFKFAPRVRQTGIKLASGNVYSRVVFKVIDENDQLVDREVLKKVSFGYNESVTVTKDDFAETDGYIVGMVIYPFGVTDGYYAYAAEINGDYTVTLFDDGYEAVRVLEPADMTKLAVEDNVVTGFDPEYTYQWAPYGMNGAMTEWTDIEGDSFTVTEVGLTAIRIKGNNATYDSSAPQVFFLEGKASDRKAITELNEDGSLIFSKEEGFKPGYYTGTRISYMNESLVAKEGAHIHLDQTVGGIDSCEEARELWLYAHTQEEAQALLDAEAEKASGYPGTVEQNTYDPTVLQAAIDSFYGQADKDYEADFKALREMIAETYKKSYVRYAYASNEIIPVDQLKSITFYNKSRQGAIVFYTKSAANFYVMDENGTVTPYTWKSEYYNNTYYSEHIHTVNVQEEVDLPESGWIVAIEFIPFADIAEDTVSAVCYTRLAYHSNAYAFEQNHVNMGFYYNNYEIEYPKLEKPAVEYANGVFTGLDTAKTYGYGRFTAGGIELTEITGVTEVAVDGVGVWGICEVSLDEDFDNSPYVIGYNKDLTNARDSIIHTVEVTKKDGTTVINVPVVANAGSWSEAAVTAPTVFNEGAWTGFSLTNALATDHNYNPMGLGTTACTIGAATAAGHIRNATCDAALEGARARAAKLMGSVYYSYEYTAAEAIPMNEFGSWSFTSAERQGSLAVLEGSLQTKFVFKVVTEDGVVDRVVYKNAALNGGGTKITVSIDDFAETDGYIVGIVIYPYGNCPEGTVIGCDSANPLVAQDFIVILGTDYVVAPAVLTSAETPVVTMSAMNAEIKITNYNEVCDYAYSFDGGDTWIPFEGDTFRATKASTEYIVKAVENKFFGESAPSEAVVSPALTLVGTSLVLDGQIGLKIYMDIDTELVNSVTYYNTKVNRDYAGVAGAESAYRISDYVTFTRSNSWMTNVQLDEETGLYYVIIYVPAKDIDNTSVETALNVYLKDAPEKGVGVSNITFGFATYVEQAKALAAAGDQEFVKALPLIESLETYTAYADNYFNYGADEAYVSSASTEGIAAPTRTNTQLAGVEFYGTSLILEDQVTIRHYFTVSDLDAFKAAYDVEGMYGTKGNYVYFDITDIPAQDLGDAKTLSITDMEGNPVYEVNYSAVNYIVDMMDDEDENLVSLVNAMYDYYLAAAEYNK